MIGQSDSTNREMREVVIQNAELSSTREATERMIKILDITYEKADLKQAVNDSHLNSEERTFLLSLIEDFEDLFDGTLGD